MNKNPVDIILFASKFKLFSIHNVGLQILAAKILAAKIL